MLGRIALKTTGAKKVLALGGRDILRPEAITSMSEGVKWIVFALNRGNESLPTIVDWAAKREDSAYLEIVGRSSEHGINSGGPIPGMFAGDGKARLLPTPPPIQAPQKNADRARLEKTEPWSRIQDTTSPISSPYGERDDASRRFQARMAGGSTSVANPVARVDTAPQEEAPPSPSSTIDGLDDPKELPPRGAVVCSCGYPFSGTQNFCGKCGQKRPSEGTHHDVLQDMMASQAAVQREEQELVAAKNRLAAGERESRALQRKANNGDRDTSPPPAVSSAMAGGQNWNYPVYGVSAKTGQKSMPNLHSPVSEGMGSQPFHRQLGFGFRSMVATDNWRTTNSTKRSKPSPYA